MMYSPRRSSAKTRDLLRALSECYKEPDEGFAGDVVSGRLQRALEEGFRFLGEVPELRELKVEGTASEVLAALKRAYHRLFSIPPRCVLPVESVFKEWTGEGGFLGGQRGLIMGPPAEDMLIRYARAGLEVPPEFESYPDHLALLLEYGGLLAGGEVPGDLGEFARVHFDGWIDELAAQVEEKGEGGFYPAVARATATLARFLREETEPAAKELSSDDA